MKIGDNVFVIDWGKKYSGIASSKPIFEWKTKIPMYSSTQFFNSHIKKELMKADGMSFKTPRFETVKTIQEWKNFKYNILEMMRHPKAGQYIQSEEWRKANPDSEWANDKFEDVNICLIASPEGCYMEIGEEGLSFLSPEQYDDEQFNALREFHRARYCVEDRDRGEVKGFPEEFIQSIYDTDDNVLFGSRYVKGKVHYDYMDGYFTKDGVPFIISVGVSYDGKGNADLPKDAIIMPYSQLPKMFPNNQFS
jgi:hypothetical protein